MIIWESKKENCDMRIQPGDTMVVATLKMSDGVPKATKIVGRIFEEGSCIDKSILHAGAMTVINLDMLGIYGNGICFLFENICDSDVVQLMCLVKSIKLDLIPAVIVQQLAAERVKIEPEEKWAIFAEVKRRVPEFKIELPRGGD